MSNGEDRRGHARANIRWPLTMETSRGAIKGETVNISPHGAYIQCPLTPDPGEEIAIVISPHDHPPLKIKAEVIWTATAQPLGMGVSFSLISKADSRFISEAVLKKTDPRINRHLKLR